ncbi:MAG: ribulose-phosphate 3-epimerase [Desulfobacterales bacterium]
MILSASILSADFGKLAEEVRAVEKAGADWVHLDVMDGHFVPNITIGPKVVEAVRRITNLPLDVHLMIDQPERYLKVFIESGADWIGVQVEAAVHLHRTIQNIKELGAKATVVLNPATSLSFIENVLTDVDMVLIMTVNPGFGGQQFISTMLPKVRKCREMIDERNPSVLLQVDGGVHEDTIDGLVGSGADVFVTGSAIFEKGSYRENILRLKAHMKK